MDGVPDLKSRGAAPQARRVLHGRVVLDFPALGAHAEEEVHEHEEEG